ncbi:MAG: hypothetical protein JWQ18_1124 [Conexibacter sp.]|nr:hypothetical protein [Conexibacter sp.]
MSPRATARPPFRLEVELHLEVVVVRARGVLDADAAEQLDECLRSLWEVGLRRLRLDVVGVRETSPEGRATLGRWEGLIGLRAPAEPRLP